MSCGSSDLDPAMLKSMSEEAWRQPATLTGDFYREPDNIVRGLSLPSASLEAPHLSAFKGFAGGDFYCEPDDILKGSATRTPELCGHGGTAGSLDFYKGPSKGSEAPSKADTILPGNERFTEADTPPDVPSDPFFKLEATTLRISSRPPCDIGNNILDFLDTRMVSSITKVSRRKFTVKAEVFIEPSSCALKARVYREERGTYAVEFQRRNGDSVTFNRVFQQATEFLSPRFIPVKTTPEADSDIHTRELYRLSMANHKGDVAPLLDMAGLRELPGLQAECAAALADLAQDVQMASRLCTRRAFEDIKKLLEADQTDIAYSTARTLLFLAQCPEAVPCFADRDLLLAMLHKVQSRATSALVQQQLAQALNAAVTRCAANLSQKVSEDVLSDLIKAIQDTGAGNAQTCRNLREAQLVLRFQCGRAPGWP